METIEVRHHEWLKNAAKEAETTFRLIGTDGVPEPLVGWFVVTKCLHLLRCVYGSDLDTITALRDHVMAKEVERLEISKQLDDAPKCIDCNYGPIIDGECLECGRKY